MCSGAVSGPERNASRFGCTASGLRIIVFWPACGCPAAPVAGLAVGTSPRPPAPGAGLEEHLGVRLAGIGQSAWVSHTSADRSMSTLGSSMIPFGTFCSQKSNHRCRVDTHTSRRESNGSTWPSWDSHSLRGMLFSASAYQNLLKWSGRTLSSLSPW